MQYHFDGNLNSQSDLETLLSCSINHAVVITNRRFKISQLNPYAEQILECHATELIGDAFQNLIDGQDEIEKMQPKTEYQIRMKTKKNLIIPVSITIFILNSKTGSPGGHLVIIKDMTKEVLQRKLNKVLIDIAHLINRSEEKDTMIQRILTLIRESLDIPAGYICLHDNLTKRLHLHSQTGINMPSVSVYCYPKTNIQCNQTLSKKCMDTYSKQVICVDNISMEQWVQNRFVQSPITEDMTIAHIPILSKTTLQGILHVLIPQRLKRLYLEETQVLPQIAEEIGVGIVRKHLEDELNKNADNLEKIIQDRTEQLRDKDAQLIQSEKLATLGEMATGVAHEINQPLGAISLIAQGLQKTIQLGKLPERLLDEKLTSVLHQVDRINKIIHHLRVFGRNAPETKEKIDINKPLTDVFDLIGRQLENHLISVELHLNPDLLVLAEHNRLEQVFLNIIGNAKDALDEQENVLKPLKRMKCPPHWVQHWEKKIIIRSYKMVNRVYVEIEDTGGGIPKHLLDKIFQPFYTTKEVGKGTGLGLSISYGIIREFGGELKADTKPGTSSIFSVILPAAK